MLKRTRAVVGLVLLSSLLLVPTSPAQAHHGNRAVCVDGTNNCDHWGSGFWPYVTTDCGFLGGTICNYTGDAERYTRDNTGGVLGFNGGNGWWGCGAWRGWVTICAVPHGHPELHGNEATTDLYTSSDFGDWSDRGHIAAARIFVDDSIYFRWDAASVYQRLMRHEFGHVAGLGERYNENSSLMSLPIVTPFYDAHDRHELTQAMYWRHD